ncbi:MAG: hypothetical protein ACXVPN_08425 [Bacteroidia bacterium]
MKKLFLTVALFSFVGAATLTAGEPSKGDDKGKKKECCKKDGKCCKKGEKKDETKAEEKK